MLTVSRCLQQHSAKNLPELSEFTDTSPEGVCSWECAEDCMSLWSMTESEVGQRQGWALESTCRSLVPDVGGSEIGAAQIRLTDRQWCHYPNWKGSQLKLPTEFF